MSIKLILKNFRCHINTTCDFGKNGLILLSGMSGKGKSSICHAINFVLYDMGTKIISYDKTTCSVEFYFDNYVIKRTKRPNRLILIKDGKITYEDDFAQGIINDVFGNAFDVVSYVQQNNYKSFITMSPLEKLSFLEKFAFNNIDLNQLKLKVKDLMLVQSQELLSITSSLNTMKSLFLEMKKPIEIPFPLPYKKNKETVIQNEYIKQKNTNILLKREYDKLKNFQDELISTKHFKELKSSITINSIDVLLNEIRELEQKIFNLNFVPTTKDEIDTLKYLELKRDIEKEISRQREEMLTKINECKNTQNIDVLENDLSVYEEIIQDIFIIKSKKTKGYKNVDEIYDTIKQEINELKNRIQNSSENVYECPCCFNKLIVKEKQLVKYNGFSIDTNEKNMLIVQLRKLEKEENELSIIKQNLLEIDEINNKYDEPLDITRESEFLLIKKDLENNIYEFKSNEKTISKLKHKLENNIYSENLMNKISNLKTIIYTNKSYEKLKEEIENNNKIETEYNILNENLKSKKEKLQNLKTKIETEEKIFKEKYQNRDLFEIENDISLIEKNIFSLENDIKIIGLNLLKIEEYKKYIEDLKPYRDFEEKIEILKEKENQSIEKNKAVALLKEKILEAESIAIVNVIDTINIHANEFLEHFFPDNPILCTLTPIKESKTSVKTQINMNVLYKGQEADLGSLSGGEYSRVVLAYTLALSKIFDSKIILLDECTSSLDSELNDIVISTIKQYFNQKLILVISHQVNTQAVFDKIIQV